MNYTDTRVLKLTALVSMVTVLLLLVALFCSSFTYRKGPAASTTLFVPRRILGPVMGTAAVPIHSPSQFFPALAGSSFHSALSSCSPG